MRSLALIVAIGIVICQISTVYGTNGINAIDDEFLQHQKLLLELLQHIHQSNVPSRLKDESRKFSFEENYHNYKNVNSVKNFVRLINSGLYPMNEIFSIVNIPNRNEAIALFQVFYNANDWNTFYNTVQWARFHVNNGVFIYALQLAMVHRQDMIDLRLPAMYELFPEYFVLSDTIQQAQKWKMEELAEQESIDGVITVVIPANYTSIYTHIDYEQKLSYFREDIGWNTMILNNHIQHPFWMGGPIFKLYNERRGELYLFQIQQILARYFMERLSNDLGPIDDLNLREPNPNGYNPSLQYNNGKYFPPREDNQLVTYHKENHYGVTLVLDYQQRIRDIIDSGFVLLDEGKRFSLSSPESIDNLGNLIQSNVDSLNSRYYKSIDNLSKMTLSGTFGEHVKTHDITPGVLKHYETMARDPMTYQFYKETSKLVWHFQRSLPPYTKKEISFEDVHIRDVSIDRLLTYFNEFDLDITSAVNIKTTDHFEPQTDLQKLGRVSQINGKDFVIKARQSRLNHIPFTIKLNVTSNGMAKSAIVRIFLGPKFDEIGREYSVTDHLENWFLLDTFKSHITMGENLIVRKSSDMTGYTKDRTSYIDLWKWIRNGETGYTETPTDFLHGLNGIPNRLMLPKGKKGGMTFRMFFIISSFEQTSYKDENEHNPLINDSRSFGFPLDRIIDKAVWNTENMLYKDVIVYNKNKN